MDAAKIVQNLSSLFLSIFFLLSRDMGSQFSDVARDRRFLHIVHPGPDPPAGLSRSSFPRENHPLVYFTS